MPDNLDALKGMVDKLLSEVDTAKKTAETSLNEVKELNSKIAQIISDALDVFGTSECSFAVGKATVKLLRTNYDPGYHIYYNNTCIFSTSSPILTLMYSETIASVLTIAVKYASQQARYMQKRLERARTVLGSVEKS